MFVIAATHVIMFLVLLTNPNFAIGDFPLDVADEYSCSPENSNSGLNNFHYRGTSLGGWLVLEPWITPSLFYQFLGASDKWGDEAPNHVAIDSFTFCKVLGKEEANRQLRRHWAAWVTEDHILQLKLQGVDTLRVPVADWMYMPYEPYIGCMDGALDELDRVIRLCEKYSISILLDLHAMRGSQNGMDNSGNTDSYEWVSTVSQSGAARYKHWEIRGGSWAGSFNQTTKQYDSIDRDNIARSLQVVEAVIARHKDDSPIVGLEPINEPWFYIPIEILKEFYWNSYKAIQAVAPHWVTLLHDSFRPYDQTWKGFMANCSNFALDAHVYLAWANEADALWFIETTCSGSGLMEHIEAQGTPIIVGEWSLATDNCAMWLNGFNDNIPGYPKVECERVKCPDPYMGFEQPGAPPDPSKGAQDPFGTGGPSYVINGTCPKDKRFENHDEVMGSLALAILHAADYKTHGQFFWNFRTEFEPQWDFLEASRLGWMPSFRERSTFMAVATACDGFGASAPAPAPAPVTMPSTPPTSDLQLRRRVLDALVPSILMLVLLGSLVDCLVRWYHTPSTHPRYEAIPDAGVETTKGASDGPIGTPTMRIETNLADEEMIAHELGPSVEMTHASWDSNVVNPPQGSKASKPPTPKAWFRS